MPSIEKHIKLSLKRTGKECKEINEWLDGKYTSSKDRVIRHNILNIPKFLPVIKEQFGEDSIKEYLQHIKDDYEINTIFKIIKKTKRLKFW